MKNSQHSEPLTGEVMPPEPDRDEALRFLAKHGRRAPTVKSYRSIEEAVAAIRAAEIDTRHERTGGRPPPLTAPSAEAAPEHLRHAPAEAAVPASIG